MPPSSDPEITLAIDHQRAVVASLGASLRQYSRLKPDGSCEEIAWGYSGQETKKGGQGDVLIPFPSRIHHGRYTFEGRTYQMECNDKECPNAIHGFLRGVVWDVAEQSTAS